MAKIIRTYNKERIHYLKEIIDKYTKQTSDVAGEEVIILYSHNRFNEPKLLIPSTIATGKYLVKKVNGSFIAEWYMEEMPGCCGICVSTSVYVGTEFQNKGIGTILNEFRCSWAKEYGFGLLMATVVTDNVAQRRVLAKNGWEELKSFTNPKTTSEIAVHVYDLTK